MTPFTVEPIGVVRASRAASVDDDWDAVDSRIELDAAAVEADATLGLEHFSHIEVVYLFHLADAGAACRGARHPRGNPDWPLTGILAQRAKDRPNRIGVTVCRLLGVEEQDAGGPGPRRHRRHARARREAVPVGLRATGRGAGAGVVGRADGGLLVKDHSPR